MEEVDFPQLISNLEIIYFLYSFQNLKLTCQLGRLEDRTHHRASCDYPLASNDSRSNNSDRIVVPFEAKEPSASTV